VNRHLFVDVHVLQTVPPANLNRDDNGTPKHAIYGGVRRARVSSQAWKRATRLAFTERIPRADLATRTKRIAGLLTDRVRSRTHLSQEQAARLVAAALQPLGIKAGRNLEDTAYPLFVARSQLDAIVDLIAVRAEELVTMPDRDLVTAAAELPVAGQLARGHSLDVALFGRMVADIPSLNVDAATQVAHALSTHAVDTEFDFYTAVDDERHDADRAGAGMIGTVEFNSATLYRFATVGVHQLAHNLDDPGAAADGLALFVDCFTRSMPSGHQNAFGHRTLPHLVVIAVRTDQPVNLVSAFERPVLPSTGLADESMVRLAAEFTAVSTTWGTRPVHTIASYTPGRATDALAEVFGRSTPFPRLCDQLRDAAADGLAAP
jgi:CRISPR system Cascade subunit CasC